MGYDMIDWHGLYKEGWQGEIVPEAFSHPAKFARGLIRRIYEHAIERGYLREGDTVLDPFGGVALGGLDAMFHGLHWVGVELEQKFVDLGQQNIDLWNRRYGNGMPRWGTAVILQGDSRNLVEVLDGARAEGIISSPPFLECNVNIGAVGDTAAKRQQIHNSEKRPTSYGTDPTWTRSSPRRPGLHLWQQMCIQSETFQALRNIVTESKARYSLLR